MRSLALLGSVVVVGGALALAGPARADTGNVRSAAEQFDAGRRAYKAGDFAEAARSFEAAYVDAPNPEALRSAIVARQKAKQLARAATLAAYAERTYPTDPALSTASKEVLGAARPALGSFVATCTPKCAVAVDGQLASVVDDTRAVVFLEPGAHTVQVEWADKSSRSFEVEARPGAERAETIEKPAAPVAPTPPPAPVTPPVASQPPVVVVAPTEPPRSHKPLPKSLFFVAAGLTVAAGAGTIVSGVLTLNSPGKDVVRQECAGLGTTCDAYRRGQNAELRTNILLGSTIGLGMLTTAIAFFTDFSSHSRTRARAVPSWDPVTRTGSLTVSGHF